MRVLWASGAEPRGIGKASGDLKGEFSIEMMISTNHQMTRASSTDKISGCAPVFFLLVTLSTGEYVSVLAKTYSFNSPQTQLIVAAPPSAWIQFQSYCGHE